MIQPSDVNEFGLIIASASGAPGASVGASTTPGNNSYGSFTSIMSGATVTDDVYGLWIIINTGFVSGAARDILITIGLDPAGGTSFSDWITDLLGSCASNYGGATAAGGVQYFFPLFIKAGTAIGAKSSVNNATVGTVSVGLKLLCKPSRPDLLRLGTQVRTYGSTAASSSGTAVTPGGASEGAWTSIGTVAAGDRPWFWQVGIGINNATMNNNGMHVDLGIGDGSNKRVVIQDELILTSTTETISARYSGAYAKACPGDVIYGRAQGTSAVTGTSLIAYGVI